MPFVVSQNMRIHYEVEGSGPPLVLQHGMFGSIEDWREYGYVAGLKEQNALILIDARGHGKSDKPCNVEDYSLDAYASDVVAVLDALGIDQCHYLGFSLGGTVGFGLAQYWYTRIRSLIILDSHPYPLDRLDGDEEDAASLEAFFLQYETSPARKARLLRNDWQALAVAIKSPCPVDVETLEKIDIPCLIVAARNGIGFEQVKRCSEEIRNSEFVSLDEFDHIDMLVRGNEVLPFILDFLSRVS